MLGNLFENKLRKEVHLQNKIVELGFMLWLRNLFLALPYVKTNITSMNNVQALISLYKLF